MSAAAEAPEAGAAADVFEPVTPDRIPAPPRTRAPARRGWVRDGAFALAVLALAFGVRAVVAQPFHISGVSMAPTLLAGDYVLVNKTAYRGGPWARLMSAIPGADALAPTAAPRHGDIVVFRNARDEGRVYVKRVVGVPGDTVALKAGLVVLNGRALPQDALGAYAGQDARGRDVTMIAHTETVPDPGEGGRRHTIFHYQYEGAPAGVDDMAPVTVPQDALFVLGDNRDDSIDSRRADRMGFVPMEAVIGRAERVVVSTTPGFRVFDPASWGEFRTERFFARADAEMRF